MFDGAARQVIDPPLNAAGRGLARLGVGADAITVAGLAVGLLGAAAIAMGSPLLGLAGIALSRLADGLDGAVARATTKTDRGGYLDIVGDFIFYGAIPLGFAIADPGANALPAAALLFAFYANGASFLAFAVMAAKRGLDTRIRGEKSLYFTAGLAEGSETIAVFIAMTLFPGWFGVLAWGFAALCLVTALSRIGLALRLFRHEG